LFDQISTARRQRAAEGTTNVMVLQQNESAAQAVQTIAILAERFPAAFIVYARRRKPLKLGIFDDLLAATAGSIPPDALKAALQRYTRHFGYLPGATRIDLDGKPAGTVTAEEAAWAAEHAAKQHRRLQAPQAGQVHAPAPAPALKRLSLADLRAAAAARRRAAS
jgi:ProP effector